MEISARVVNNASGHQVDVRTDGSTQTVPISAKSTGRGSSVNGGEFLMLALATCYCNDLYREADRLQIPIEGVEVEASAHFDGVGLAARDIHYRARITSPAPAATIAELLRHTDAVAEIHNTVRAGLPVTLMEDGLTRSW